MKGEKIRMKDLAERFHEVGVVPVVVLEDVKDAVPLAPGACRRRTSMCRSNFPYSGSRRVYPSDD